MSVLPSSTTLYSFFIVLTGLLIATLATGYLIAPLATRADLPFQRPSLGSILYFLKLLLEPYTVIKGLGWDLELPDGWCEALILIPIIIPYILVTLPVVIVEKLLIPEILFPRDQWIMSRYIGNKYVNIQWHPLAFVRDGFRLLLLPVWVALAVVLVVYTSTLGLVLSSLKAVAKFL
jgi:hypothetical protein